MVIKLEEMALDRKLENNARGNRGDQRPPLMVLLLKYIACIGLSYTDTRVDFKGAQMDVARKVLPCFELRLTVGICSWAWL